MALGRLLIREKSHHHFYKIPLEGVQILSLYSLEWKEGRRHVPGYLLARISESRHFCFILRGVVRGWPNFLDPHVETPSFWTSGSMPSAVSSRWHWTMRVFPLFEWFRGRNIPGLCWSCHRVSVLCSSFPAQFQPFPLWVCISARSLTAPKSSTLMVSHSRTICVSYMAHLSPMSVCRKEGHLHPFQNIKEKEHQELQPGARWEYTLEVTQEP